MKTSLLLVCGIFALQGCATVFRAQDEYVMFTSSPTGASVLLSNGESCFAPCGMRFDRTKDLTASFSHKGEVKSVSLDSTFRGPKSDEFVGNVLFFGAIGVLVDAFSGSNKSLGTNHVHVEFD